MFCGIDVGTQGVKCIIADSHSGKIVAQSHANYDMISGPNGKREQDPKIWVSAVGECLDIVFGDSCVDRKNILGIGVSGQQHGFVALDNNFDVIRPAKLWCDTESIKEAEYIINEIGGEKKLVEITGNTLPVGFTASKVLWMKIHEPDNYKKLKKILLPHDYISYWLTGNFCTDMGDASGTGYFSIKSRSWANEILRIIDPHQDLSEFLPKILRFDEVFGHLRSDLVSRFGLESVPIVSSGGGDNMMAAIGTGNIVPGIVTMSLGTSGTIFTYSNEPIFDQNGDFAAFCSSNGGWLPLICTMNVTVTTEKIRNILGISLDELNNEAEKATIGSEGIRIIPYFNGERTPNRPDATCTMYGITSANFSKTNLCRAAIEGASLSLKYGLSSLLKKNIEYKSIILVGGGSKSKVWRQIIADMFGCKVYSLLCHEAACLGCIIQANYCYCQMIHLNESMEHICDKYICIDIDSICEPVSEHNEQYSKISAEYIDFEKKVYG